MFEFTIDILNEFGKKIVIETDKQGISSDKHIDDLRESVKTLQTQCDNVDELKKGTIKNTISLLQGVITEHDNNIAKFRESNQKKKAELEKAIAVLQNYRGYYHGEES